MTRPKHKLPDRIVRYNNGNDHTYVHVLWAEINEAGISGVNDAIQEEIDCHGAALSHLSTNWLPLYRHEGNDELFVVFQDNVDPLQAYAIIVFSHEIVSSCAPYVDPNRELWDKCCEIALAITDD